MLADRVRMRLLDVGVKPEDILEGKSVITSAAIVDKTIPKPSSTSVVTNNKGEIYVLILSSPTGVSGQVSCYKKADPYDTANWSWVGGIAYSGQEVVDASFEFVGEDAEGKDVFMVTVIRKMGDTGTYSAGVGLRNSAFGALGSMYTLFSNYSEVHSVSTAISPDGTDFLVTWAGKSNTSNPLSSNIRYRRYAIDKVAMTFTYQGTYILSAVDDVNAQRRGVVVGTHLLSGGDYEFTLVYTASMPDTNQVFKGVNYHSDKVTSTAFSFSHNSMSDFRIDNLKLVYDGDTLYVMSNVYQHAWEISHVNVLWGFNSLQTYNSASPYYSDDVDYMDISFDDSRGFLMRKSNNTIIHTFNSVSNLSDIGASKLDTSDYKDSYANEDIVRFTKINSPLNYKGFSYIYLNADEIGFRYHFRKV